MVRDLLDFRSYNSEVSDGEVNYHKFVLHKATKRKFSIQRTQVSPMRKKSYAFGSSIERSKDDIKLPPLPAYEISYSQVDVKIPNVRLLQRNTNLPKKRVITEASIHSYRNTKQVKPQEIEKLRTSKQRILKVSDLEIPNQYFPKHQFPPLSSSELHDLFQSLLTKHHVRRPSQNSNSP